MKNESETPVQGSTKRKPWGLVIGALMVTGSFAGGLLLGMDVVDPMDSEEYEILRSSNSIIIAQRDQIRADYDALENSISEREAAIDERDTELSERSGELDERQEELASQEAEIVEREKAVGKIEEAQAANSVGNGVWTVGEDIQPGTYRSNEAVGSDCYWAVLVSGTNGNDIVNNGIPGGGRPKVTVKKGQDLELKRCGTWVKQ